MWGNSLLMYKIDGNETEYNLCKQGIQNDSLPHINKVINFTIVQYICKKKCIYPFT